MNTFVAFSGGVDSTALALLEGAATPVFTDTGWEFPDVYSHIAAFEEKTGREVVRLSRAETLPEYIEKTKFMPGHASRYCTRMFKVDVLNNFLRGHLPATLMIGLRADEPLRVGNLSQVDGLEIAYPLRERGLRRVDVLGICIQAGLMPRYPAYMARGGCVGCFYKRKSEVIAMAEMVPAVLDELQALEETIQDERGRFALMFPNTGSSIRSLRSQARLFDSSELYRDAADTSDVGAECGLFCHR